MFSHIFFSVDDFDRALGFYRPVMQALGLGERFCDPGKPWAGWHGAGCARPLFVISKPFDGQPHVPGNGQMIAFLAADRAMVRAVHRTALAHGELVRRAARPAAAVPRGLLRGLLPRHRGQQALRRVPPAGT